MKIVLIGAGNVATHLGRKLAEAGEEILQVFSRNLSKAKQLANELRASAICDLEATDTSADIYIIAVHDDAIMSVAKQLAQHGLTQKLVVHTSGATPRSVFEQVLPKLERVGVFYPLQSFSKIRQPDFSQIPFCVDANLAADANLLAGLAHKLSPHVYPINDAQRATLHLAAVFVNNFTNHLFTIGEKLLKAGDLPFELLLPLIRETVAKLDDGSPADMQTGPASRHDEVTIERHLQQLEGHPSLKSIYQMMTEAIISSKYQSGSE